MQQLVVSRAVADRVLEHVRFIPDEEIEPYFVAADALVLPYTYIFQSGVLFLAYSFGVPVIASDVGSLKEFIREGLTGFVCRPKDAADLADAIRRFFTSDLYRDAEARRAAIRMFANTRHSWQTVAEITAGTYAAAVGRPSHRHTHELPAQKDS
jgi:glycosyltransferase involved in cell wall biosynthesis